MAPDYSIAELVTDLSLAAQLKIGMQLDRAQTNKLLNQLLEIESSDQGHAVMIAQLRHVLTRKDWLRIHVSAESPEALRRTGVTIGIVATKPNLPRPKLSALQSEQNRFHKGRKRH